MATDRSRAAQVARRALALPGVLIAVVVAGLLGSPAIAQAAVVNKHGRQLLWAHPGHRGGIHLPQAVRASVLRHASGADEPASGALPAHASGYQVVQGWLLAPGTSLTRLNGAGGFHSIAVISLLPSGATGHIITTVIWRSTAFHTAKGGPPAQLQISYALTVVKQNGTWYVRDISAATESPGSP